MVTNENSAYVSVSRIRIEVEEPKKRERGVGPNMTLLAGREGTDV